MEIGLREARQAAVVPTSPEAATVHKVEDLRDNTIDGAAGKSLGESWHMSSGRRDGWKVVNNYGLSPE